jgi:hypothetical protein
MKTGCARRKNICVNLCLSVAEWFVEISELAKALVALGCPPEKSADMAAQLDKRARQLAAQKGCSADEARQHLLNLMRQGWAAGGRSQVLDD